MKTVDEEILELLADDQPRSTDEIIDDLHRQGFMVRQALKRLCRESLVVSKKHAKRLLFMSQNAAKEADEKTQEQVVSILMTGVFSAKTIARKVRISEPKALWMLEDMAEKGVISRSKTSRFTSYYVSVVQAEEAPIVAPQYHPPFNREFEYKLGGFQRLCEGARNNERGYV